MSKKEVDEKPYFFQRLLAFLLDIFIVSIVASILSSPFIKTKEIEPLQTKYFEVMENYMNQKIDTNEYTAEIINIQYQLSQLNGIVTIITIIISILYFVVYQLYSNGQTIGKKIFKIKVVSTNKDLSMNQLIFRSFLANNILLDILSMIFVIFSSKSIYFYCVGLLSILQYVFIIISFFMIIFSKEGLGLHDRLVHTKVVKVS